MEPHSKICVIEQNVSITLVRCSGKFEALIRKLVTPLMKNGVSKVQTELDFQVPQKNKYRTTSEIKFNRTESPCQACAGFRVFTAWYVIIIDP